MIQWTCNGATSCVTGEFAQSAICANGSRVREVIADNGTSCAVVFDDKHMIWACDWECNCVKDGLPWILYRSDAGTDNFGGVGWRDWNGCEYGIDTDLLMFYGWDEWTNTDIHCCPLCAWIDYSKAYVTHYDCDDIYCTYYHRNSMYPTLVYDTGLSCCVGLIRCHCNCFRTVDNVFRVEDDYDDDDCWCGHQYLPMDVTQWLNDNRVCIRQCLYDMGCCICTYACHQCVLFSVYFDAGWSYGWQDSLGCCHTSCILLTRGWAADVACASSSRPNALNKPNGQCWDYIGKVGCLYSWCGCGVPSGVYDCWWFAIGGL